MPKYFKFFISLFLLLSLHSVSLKALTAEETSFAYGQGFRSNELLTSPQAKVPSPEVNSYLSRIDFSGGKINPGELFVKIKHGIIFSCIYYSRNYFSYCLSSIPVFILNGVFRI